MKIYKRAIVTQLNSKLLEGLGRGVSVNPITFRYAQEIIPRVDNIFDAIITGNLSIDTLLFCFPNIKSEILDLNHLVIIDDFSFFTNLKDGEMWDEVLYVQFLDDMVMTYSIKPL